MADDTTVQGVLFEGLSSKPVVVQFDQDATSSDGGAILLKACDEALGLTARLEACLSDLRQAGKVQHGVLDMFRQRVYGLACGYENVNDSYLAVNNENPKPFVWSNSADDILASIQRFCLRTFGSEH